METTHDFDEWLETVELDNYEDVNSLYRSVEECDQYGSFVTQVANGEDNGWIVKEEFSDFALHLASEKARQAFLNLIEDRYCDGMSMEGWYSYHREMEKD